MPVRVATGNDLAYARDLVARCGLPAEDVRVAPEACQLVWIENDAAVGTVGYDLSGDLALLRSLAVEPAWRGRRLGHRLTIHAETRAAEAGARRFVLLTETADALALACGYAAVSRCSLGEAAAAFRQFNAGCCAGARCYVKTATED